MLPRKTSNVSLKKAIAFGLILIPLNAYWIALVSGMHHSFNPAYSSLFITPVFNLFFLLLLGLLLKKTLHWFAFNRAELLIIYQMLVMLCTVSGHNPMDFLLGTLAHPFWFATYENEYANLFHRYIPQWFAVRDKEVLAGFFEGDSTLYTAENISAWLGPILLWSLITFVIFFILICINSIQRLQWTEREKLSYPIVQLPIEMTESGFFKKNLLWFGFAIASFIEIVNGLHFLYPVVPGIPIKGYNLGQIFTTKPWNAIGWLPIYLYPWVIGLTFFVPLDMSFSVWFFFLFTKIQLIIGSIGGWKSLPGYPYYNHQGLGAWITLGILILLASRKHLKGVFARVFSKRRGIDDSKEAFSYRTTVIAIIIGMVFLVALFHQAGMSIGILLAFFAIYFAMSISITHARATVGLPYHEIYQTHPQLMLVSALGTRKVGPANLTILSFLYPYVRDNVSHPMPSQLEGLKIAERVGIDNRKITIAMIVGLFFSTLAAFWAYLHVMYRYGATLSSGYILGIGRENFDNLLSPWLQIPRDVDVQGVSFTALASVFTIFLMVMKRRFIWWPFHPAGYALGLSSGTVWIWSAVLAGWLIKAIILKFGGLKLYRKAGPFFFGIVLGDYVIGSLWSIIGTSLGIQVYRVWY